MSNWTDIALQDAGGLKPCPFCGGKAEFKRDSEFSIWIECSQCKSGSAQFGRYVDEKYKECAFSWNARTGETK